MGSLRRWIGFVGVLLMAQGASVAQAQRVFDLRGEDFSLWSRLGTALYQQQDIPGYTARTLILTGPFNEGSAASAFASYTPVVDMNAPFTAYFFFFMSPGANGAGDGMTFIMTSNAGALGIGGSELGYGGSGLDGYAFAIDTFNFEGEPVAPSLQILENGSVQPISFFETGIADIRDPNYFVWNAVVSYVPSGNGDETGTLTATIEQAFDETSYTVSAPVNWQNVGQPVIDPTTELYVGRPLRFGFSAGTGAADDGHFVHALTPAPEPGLGAMIFAGTAVLGVASRRRLASTR